MTSPSPDVVRLIEALATVLGLGQHEFAFDTLVVCDSRWATPEEIASCAPRLESSTRGVEAIVCLSERTHALACLAGLCSGTQWDAPMVPVVIGSSAEDLAPKLAGVLGVATQSGRLGPQVDLSSRAKALLAVHGGATGSRVWRAERWSTRANVPLTVADVAQHLTGRRYVAAFRPKGPWPWVVLDLDRHDALQEQNFHDSLARLKGLLPGAFVVQSSMSRGAHIYVHLPPGTLYETGAVFMRAYLLTSGLRFVRARLDGGRELRSELVEAKNHPPRLPFGRGSSISGSRLDPAQQLDDFLAWARHPNDADFVRCRKAVRKHVGLGPRWDAFNRHRLRMWEKNQEIGLVPAALPPGDPWAPMLPLLPPHLRILATTGVPAYGTRTRWTEELLETLTSLVEEAEATKLLAHWLHERHHVSSDIERSLDVVLLDLPRRIRSKYGRLKGVPLHHWDRIESLVRSDLQYAKAQPELFPRLRDANELVEDEVLATAFFIARRYYVRGTAERSISAIEFAEFAGKNKAHDVQELLSWRMGWLSFQAKGLPGARSRTYRLLLWPAPAFAPELLRPPFRVPRRRYWLRV